MKKIFWENPYQHSLVTTVASVECERILLEETIAFSFSGGQESDKAWIHGYPVLNSELEGNLIYYTLPTEHRLAVGDEVSINIDWPRRYRLMRLHFAAELVLELITRKLAVQKIGAHIAESKARIDFISHQNISLIFPALLADYNQIIEEDRLIKTGFSDVSNQRRYWEIDGFSRVACGGTHVKSTAEVGAISLKRVNIGGGKERIEIRLVELDLGLANQ
ncbi:MAG: alanyl-tRNA editing protein [Legionella sp.]|uniref:alanyl-tRNA editing protein n=1 Tax=Legionella sp. TaxID=459 RepID=UPI00283B9106|nr:alanyl-tRNA editing protein [Legionella sp.]